MGNLTALLAAIPARKIVFAVLLLLAGAVAGLAGTVYFLGAALKDRLQERWPAGLAAEIQARSVAFNRTALQAHGENSDAFVRMPSDAFRQQVSKQLAKLRSKKLAGKDGVELTVISHAVDLHPQAIAPRLEFRVTKGVISIHAEAAGTVAPHAQSNAVLFDIAMGSLKIHSVTAGSFWSILTATLVDPLNSLLTESMEIINAVIDSEVNPIKVRVDFGPLADTSLQEITKNGDFRAADRRVYWSPELVRPAILIAADAVTVVAQVRNRTKEEDDDLTERGMLIIRPEGPTGDVKRLPQDYADYAKQVHDRALSHFALGAADLRKALVALAKPYVAQTLNNALKTPVCGTYHLDKKFKPFNEAFTLGKPPARFECTRDIEACLKKSVCDSKEQCRDKIEIIPARKSIENRLDDACVVAACAQIGGLGCALKRVRENIKRACTKAQEIIIEAERRIVHVAEGAICESFRQLNKLSPEVCAAADKLTAPDCVALNAVSAAGCTARAGAMEYFSKNPLAKLKGQAEVKGQVQVCVTATVSDKFDRATFALNATGAAEGAVDVDFDPSLLLQALPALGLPAALTCVAGFEKRFTGGVKTSLRDAVGASLDSDKQGDNLVLRFTLDKKTVNFDLDRSPLDIVFAKNPELLVKCSLLLSGTLAYAAWDTAVSKHLSPILTGKKFEHEFDQVKFALRIPALKVDDLKLVGAMNEKSLAFSN